MKKWVQTSEEPEAYGYDGKWGLVKTGEKEWDFYAVFSNERMKKVDSCSSVNPPLYWGDGQVEKWRLRRKDAHWDEREVGKPGEEGYNGGAPLPMHSMTSQEQRKKAVSRERRIVNSE